MKKWLPSVAVLLVPLSAVAGATPVEKTDAFVRLLRTGEFGAARAWFDPAMKDAMSEAQLQQVWHGLIHEAGALVKITEHRQAKQGRLTVVDAIAEFENGPLAIRVVLDSTDRVSGLWFLSLDKTLPITARVEGTTPHGLEYRRPAYSKEGAFTETAVTVGDEPWRLAGLVTTPAGKGPFPAVLMLSGSGPNDMDETIGPNKPLRDLAEGLSSRGILVLRYDKRTRAHGAKMNAGKVTVQDEVLTDAARALAVVRKLPGVDPSRVYVLGHSLGGALAPLVAEEDGRLAGVIILAGSGRPLAELMDEQLDYIGSLATHQGAAEQKQLAMLKADLAAYRAGKLAHDATILGASAHYLRDLEARKPLEAASRVEVPFLVLQGGRDYQVTEVDFEAWKKALAKRENARFRYYDDLNHLFATGKGMATPEEYTRPQSVAPQVVADIASWIAKGAALR